MNERTIENDPLATRPEIETALQGIGDDVRAFVARMEEQGAKLTDEVQRSELEAALSQVVQQYEPFYDKRTRDEFSERLDRDAGAVDLTDDGRGDPRAAA